MIKSIAIGSFDGIHLAHQKLIDSVDGVVIVERGSSVLTPGYTKAKHIKKPTFFYHFENIKDLSPKEFVALLQSDFKDLASITVGYDFHFGKDKSGDTNTLKELFKNVNITQQIKLDAEPIHSRTIKEKLREGDIKGANRLLGREYEIDGIAISGQGLGKKELIPTINLEVNSYLLPKNGIYATKTEIGDSWFDSVSFIGNRVSTDGKFAVETHIIDQTLGATSGSVCIAFKDFIRENLRFSSLDALKEQILKDIEIARRAI